MMKDQFDALDQSFGIPDDDMSVLDLMNITNDIDTVKHENTSLVEMINDGDDFQDLKEHMLKSIKTTDKIMTTLSEQIQIGIGPGMVTATAEMINALTAQQRELRTLYQTRAEIGIKIMKVHNDAKKAENPSTLKSGTVQMNAKDLLDMISQAKSQNFMNAIDASFEVSDD